MAHLRTHYKIKPYICTYCSKSFNEKGNLKTHIRIHTGERPFKCKKCQKSFKALGQLKDHFISHTGLKPFQCPYCKKYYRRKEILKNHFDIHKKEDYFINNKDAYEQMIQTINKMKNIVLYYNDNKIESKKDKVKNNNKIINLNSTNSGNDTNLSLGSNSLEEKNQEFPETNNEKNNLNTNIDKNDNIKDNKISFDDSDFYVDFVENNMEKEIINFNYIKKEQTENINLMNSESNNNDSKFPLYPIDNISNLNSKEENNNLQCNNNINIENKDFSFQIFPEITEKEISVSSIIKYYDFNLYNKNEKADNDIENNDCYSKITNLYFQTYQHKIKINI